MEQLGHLQQHFDFHDERAGVRQTERRTELIEDYHEFVLPIGRSRDSLAADVSRSTRKRFGKVDALIARLDKSPQTYADRCSGTWLTLALLEAGRTGL